MYPNLKLEIWVSGLRQNRVARELKIDETVLSKIINGHREPSPSIRTLLSGYLGRDESWLFQREIQERKGKAHSNSKRVDQQPGIS